MTLQLRGTIRVFLGIAALGAVGACHVRSAPVADNAIRATAFLLDSLGKEVGNVRFTETPGTPGVAIAIEIARGATTGQHGIHLHTVGKCDAAGAFASAGGHFNPAGKKHGLFSPDGPHAGDLEALTVDSFGHTSFVATLTRFTLSPGPNSLLDADGSSIVLHALPDDQRTDPSGNSGARIACGVVVKT
ncbi:MAG: superoxide dismutase family protein [bacterium]